MEKTIFEQMGGTYTKQGDYYLPNLTRRRTEACRRVGTATRKVLEAKS